MRVRVETTWFHIQRSLLFLDRAAFDRVCIDHRCADIAMSEHVLDRADIDVRLKQMAGESVAECMGRDALHQFRASDG